MLLPTLETALRRARVRPGTLWLVAVSGGPDSLALLHALTQLQATFGLRLHAATFDHQLRGDDSAADVAFVMQTAAAWGVPATSGSADVRALAEASRLSIEAAARSARYGFLALIARQISADAVATAHNADDQAETVLMHVIRGAGLAGLSGMRPVAPLPDAPDVTLVRPLLDVTRAEVEAYCDEHGLTPRVDATNAVPLYLRNRLRLEVMPLLREINPQVARQLRQLAQVSAVDADYIEEAFARDVAAHATVTPDEVALGLARFRDLHPALQRRFVVWAARRLSPRIEVSYVQQVTAVDVAMSGSVGAQATLPDGLRLRVDYDTVVVEREARSFDERGFWLEPGTELTISVPGTLQFDGWTLRLVAGHEDDANARLSVPQGALLTLRTRRPGDRFAPLGMQGHTQTLKRWLIDHKVPQRWRDRIPLLVINGAIAALVLGERWPISHNFAPDDDESSAVSLTAFLTPS